MKATFAEGHTLWQCWIVMLCATGISCAIVGPQSFSVNSPPDNRVRNGASRIRRFACPVGFFRLRRNCYYLSAGTASWRDAYFHCKDRNSTLAVLDKNGKDKTLTKYLMGEQFNKLERWIGGIYNWQQMSWVWGVSGKKISYQNFEKLDSGDSKQYAWHCIVMDPSVNYMWKPRSCVEKKHYVCEVQAGGIGRRRRKRIDQNLTPQNQREKPIKGKRRKGKAKERTTGVKVDDNLRRRNGVQHALRRGRKQHNKDQPWANGEKLGSRAPKKMLPINGTRTLNRARHRPRTYIEHNTPKTTEMSQQSQQYAAFLGDSPGRAHPQSLSDEDIAINLFSPRMNDLAHEEILLKT